MTAIDPAHLVGTGGAIGALLRYLIGERLESEEFPFGTVTVNVVGSFVLAFITFAGMGEQWLLFFGIGACGSFTTFSSFSFETVWLWESGKGRAAVLNAVGTLLGAIAAIGLAWVLVALLAGNTLG